MNKIFLVILVLLFSCSQRVDKKPEHLLSESQMIEILVEVHLLESAYQLNMIKGMKDDSLNIGDYYDALFASKECSFEEFDQSFTYYSEDPKTMEILLDSVLTRIQMME